MVKSGNTTAAVAWVDTNEAFSVWSPLAMIRANSEFMSPRYVFHYTNSAPFQTSILLACSYGTQPNIGMGVIEQQPIAVPPLEEQATIASVPRLGNRSNRRAHRQAGAANSGAAGEAAGADLACRDGRRG